MMAVTVETEPAFRIVSTRKLFEGPYADNSHTYDVSRDGKRFLMVKESEPSATELVVVLNWFEELERLVPADR